MSSHLPVQAKPLELNLLPQAFLAAFIIFVMMLCFGLFPSNTIPDLALSETNPQPLTAFYLEKLSDHHPEDINLKIALTEQVIGLNEWSRANALLSELALNPSLQNQLTRLTFILRLTMAYSLPKGVTRTNELDILKAKIPSLLNLHLTPAQDDQLGNIALKLGAPESALQFFQRVIEANPNQSASYYETIARVALASSQYDVSAKFYLIASQHHTQIELKRTDIIEGLKAYQSGDLMQKGIAIMQELPDEIINNQAMLLFLTKYAITANRADLAATYITRSLLGTTEVSP